QLRSRTFDPFLRGICGKPFKLLLLNSIFESECIAGSFIGRLGLAIPRNRKWFPINRASPLIRPLVRLINGNSPRSLGKPAGETAVVLYRPVRSFPLMNTVLMTLLYSWWSDHGNRLKSNSLSPIRVVKLRSWLSF